MKYWIALVVCLVALAGLSACGGDDNSKENARISAIGSLSENAVDAWTANGPAGLYNILHQDVMATCSVEDFDAAMADQPQPTAWRNTKDIKLQGDDLSTATATVTIVADGQDIEQPWSFGLENNVRWRVTDMPGLSGCVSQ